MHHVRAAAAIAAPRPAYGAGLRAALACVVPLALAPALHLRGGLWICLAGFNGALSDKGGPYRDRALTHLVLTLATMAATALSAAAYGRWMLAVPLTLALGFACSLARVWGNAGASVGSAVLSTFLIALAIPPTPGVTLGHEMLGRAAWVAVGGGWSALLSLVLWPLRPYRPVRLAVAACHRALADYADELAARAAGHRSHDAWEMRTPSVAVRTAIEQARDVLAAVRRGRAGETPRGERLLVLHEIAEQLFGHLLALGETLEAIPGGARDPAVHALIAATLGDLAATARATAAATEAERDPPPVTARWNGHAVRDALGAGPSAGARAGYEHAALLLDRAAQYAAVGATTVAALDTGREAPADAIAVTGSWSTGPAAETRREAAEVLALSEGPRLRDVLTPGPVLLRHAARVAVVCAAAVSLADALGLAKGYWMTITVVVILQPHTGATTQKALQRLLGTVLGALLAAALGALFHDALAVTVLAFVFVTACVALLPVNYAAYSVFLTPAFVLLAEVGEGDWHLAHVRVLNTLIGGTLAFLGARLLWPLAEWRQLPEYMAAAARANRAYLRLALARLTSDDGEAWAESLRAARRAIAIAAADAEEAFQRALGEHRGPAAPLEGAMTFLTYTRRVARSIGALALVRHSGERAPAAVLERFGAGVDALLADLEAAIVERRAPNPFPPLGSVPVPDERETPLLSARVNRLARQLKSLHDAVGQMRSEG